MIILLDTDIVVQNCSRTDRINVIGIVQAIVCVVMANTADQHWE